MEVGYGGGGGGVYVRSKVINIKWEFGPWESIGPFASLKNKLKSTVR